VGFAAVAGFGLGVVMAESEAGAAAAAEVGGLDGGAGEGAEAKVEEGGAAAASGCEGGGASMLFDELLGRSVRGNCGAVRSMEELNQVGMSQVRTTRLGKRTGTVRTELRNARAVVSTAQRPDVVVRRPHRLTQELPPPDGNGLRDEEPSALGRFDLRSRGEWRRRRGSWPDRQSPEATPTDARPSPSAADGLCWAAGAALRTADGLRWTATAQTSANSSSQQAQMPNNLLPCLDLPWWQLAR
jgi:hypothetical protein